MTPAEAARFIALWLQELTTAVEADRLSKRSHSII
jgi:hypothetical protein